MPPAKSRLPDDGRSETSTARERQVAAAANARKAKSAAAAAQNVSSVTVSSLVTMEPDNTFAGWEFPGMDWEKESTQLLNAYRVSRRLSAPAAFTSPLNEALLTIPGIGRQSPTMARKKGKRRVPKEKLALAVRRSFNDAAVNETDVVVELVYKIRNQDKAFRMRSTPGISKKA